MQNISSFQNSKYFYLFNMQNIPIFLFKIQSFPIISCSSCLLVKSLLTSKQEGGQGHVSTELAKSTKTSPIRFESNPDEDLFYCFFSHCGSIHVVNPTAFVISMNYWIESNPDEDLVFSRFVVIAFRFMLWILPLSLLLFSPPLVRSQGLVTFQKNFCSGKLIKPM